MISGIDHLVILVPKLDDAMDAYRKLGFQVLPGGEHPYGTHNALVPFQDGSYLELIAFQDPTKHHDHRWYRFLNQPGLVDFAVVAANVEDELVRIREEAGVAYQDVKPGARKRPDGVQLEWRTLPPEDTRTGELPFLIDDVTDRTLRVPGGDEATHENNITGIRKLVVAVRELDEAVTEYNAVFGRDATLDKDEELGADTATYYCGEHQIVLAYPTTPSSPLVRRIQQGGDGPFEVTFTAEESIITRELNPAETGGVRMIVE
ncbi:MAG: VOC family protein [Sphaerobacteraceae bacterium]|nr:MAG: VOC family protein [Sphaerobacteraceae bacterium]